MPLKKQKTVSQTSKARPEEPEVISVPIDWLLPHPLQDQMFSPLSPHEFDAFVQDIARRGLQVPLDVLPVNAAGLPEWTIVAGHQRLRAAQALGWTKIKVRVRHDWAEKSAAAIEDELISDNFVRRQLSRLQQAKCMLRLFEIELGRVPGDLLDCEKLDARECVARRFRCSVKTVSRKLDILTTPIEVQNAYDNGQLKIELAVKVAHLPVELLLEIAARIRAGEPARNVAMEYVRRKPIIHVERSPLVRVNKLLQEIAQLVPDDLSSVAAECPLSFAEDMLQKINGVRPLILKLTDALQQAKTRSAAAIG